MLVINHKLNENFEFGAFQRGAVYNPSNKFGFTPEHVVQVDSRLSPMGTGRFVDYDGGRPKEIGRRRWFMTIVERALELVCDGLRIGLGSGHAAQAFVMALGQRVRNGPLDIRGVPTSKETESLATQEGIPLMTPAQAGILDLTVDGADEVDPNLDLIKGYGRALVREKIVAASSRKLIILVGEEKLVSQLGSRGKLPVEVTPFALPLCERRLQDLGCRPIPYVQDKDLFVTDNGNHILDCQIDSILDAKRLELDIRAIPGVVGTGLFLGMADTVLVGKGNDFQMVEERRRGK